MSWSCQVDTTANPKISAYDNYNNDSLTNLYLCNYHPSVKYKPFLRVYDPFYFFQSYPFPYFGSGSQTLEKLYSLSFFCYYQKTGDIKMFSVYKDKQPLSPEIKTSKNNEKNNCPAPHPLSWPCYFVDKAFSPLGPYF